jgi:hypothetical protein
LRIIAALRVCKRGVCRRNKCCRGNPDACLRRGWKLFSTVEQNRAWRTVQHGGPRHVPPAAALEKACAIIRRRISRMNNGAHLYPRP